MRFNRFPVGANRADGRMTPRPVGCVPSPVCSFEVIKAFVLLPHQGRDDYREHDDERYHHDELQHRFHRLLRNHGPVLRALGIGQSQH